MTIERMRVSGLEERVWLFGMNPQQQRWVSAYQYKVLLLYIFGLRRMAGVFYASRRALIPRILSTRRSHHGTRMNNSG
jgi:hypothetical protein